MIQNTPADGDLLLLVVKTYYYCKVWKIEIKCIKYLEEKFYQRSDEWGDEVSLRLAEVQNDVVSANRR